MLGDVPPALLNDVAERLRGACAHLQPDAFAALVLEIARTKLRFARRAASIPGLSGVWDPPHPLATPMAPSTEPGTEADAG